MEKSKIPFVSRLKPPQTMLPLPKSSTRVLQPVEQNKAHEDPIKLQPARRMLSRRSKSFSDLRPTLKTTDILFKRPGLTSTSASKVPPSKSLVKSTSTSNLCAGASESKRPLLKSGLKTIPETSKSAASKQPQASVSTRSTVKRPAAAGTDEAAKPKVSKPAKIPPYDYKARFNFLNEKHTILMQTYKDAKQKIIDVEQDLQEYGILKNNHLKLKEEFDSIFKEKSQLQTENLKVFEERDEYRSKLEQATTAIQQLQQQNERLRNENSQALSSISNLEEVKDRLENELDILKNNHNDLQKNHSSLQNDHSKLQFEHQCLTVVKEQLDVDLVKAHASIETLENDLNEYKKKGAIA